jgi:hypothetical protein
MGACCSRPDADAPDDTPEDQTGACGAYAMPGQASASFGGLALPAAMHRMRPAMTRPHGGSGFGKSIICSAQRRACEHG